MFIQLGPGSWFELLWVFDRPRVIVICNSNDYNCLSNSNRWNRMQCNSNRKQSNSNSAITLLLQLNISITPKFNFIENNQTKKLCILAYWDLDKHRV